MPCLRLVHSNVWPERANVCSARKSDVFDPAVRMLLEHVRTITPLPQAVRARALARAVAASVSPLGLDR